MTPPWPLRWGMAPDQGKGPFLRQPPSMGLQACDGGGGVGNGGTGAGRLESPPDFSTPLPGQVSCPPPREDPSQTEERGPVMRHLSPKNTNTGFYPTRDSERRNPHLGGGAAQGSHLKVQVSEVTVPHSHTHHKSNKPSCSILAVLASRVPSRRIRHLYAQTSFKECQYFSSLF